MEVAVQQGAAAEFVGSCDLVQPSVKIREQPHLCRHAPRPTAQCAPHARSVDPLQHEPVVTHVVDDRNRVAVRACVLHRARFTRRVTVAAVPPQHGPIAEIEDLGFATAADTVGTQRSPPRSLCARKKFSLPAVAIAALAEISSASVAAATTCAKR